jgi:hypothetical protein
MPWSAKAQELLQKQYAPVGNAGVRALKAESDIIAKATLRVPGLETLSASTSARLDAVERYTRAYREYCWPVSSLADLKLAPFHILASEDAVHTDKPHIWHMETIGKLCAADPKILLATPFHGVDLDDDQSSADAVAWWTELTSRGGEGMVVKPLNFIAEGPRGVTQPAIKCGAPNTSASFMAPNTCCPRTLNGCVLGTLERNAPSPAGNLPWESSLWNALSVRSRYDSLTNASSVFLLSKVNRSTLGCSRNVVIKNLGREKEDATESAGHRRRVLSPC